MAKWLRYWIPNQGVLGSEPVSGSKFDSAFILSRLMKWVSGTPGDLKVKSEQSPRSGSVSLRKLNLIHKKVAESVFLRKIFKVLIYCAYYNSSK